MELKVIIDEEMYTLNVPDQFLDQASGFFDKMDTDMDQGIQMSRNWVESPDLIARLKLVGDKLLTALENENNDLGRMMAGYILSRAPNIDTMTLDTSGDINETEIEFKQNAAPVSFGMPEMADPYGMDPQLRENAEKQVSKVFKQGRHYSFSVYNAQTDSWESAATVKDEEEAERLRNDAVIQRMIEMSMQ